MQALKDRRVQLALVGLLVAVAAAYGIKLDEQQLLAVVAALAAAAGGVSGVIASRLDTNQQTTQRDIMTVDLHMDIAELSERVQRLESLVDDQQADS